MTSISIFDPSLLPTEAHTCTCTYNNCEETLMSARDIHERNTRGGHAIHVYARLSLTRIAVIAVAPTGEAFFVYNYVQTRPMGQYNGK